MSYRIPLTLTYGVQDSSHTTYFLTYLNQEWVMWMYKEPQSIFGSPTKVVLTPYNISAASCGYVVARDLADQVEYIINSNGAEEVVALVPNIFIPIQPVAQVLN